MKVKDERDSLINELCVKLAPQYGNMQELKNLLYMILNPYEITTRSTEVAVVDEDQNETLLRRFLVAKKVSGIIKPLSSAPEAVLADLRRSYDLDPLHQAIFLLSR